MLISALIPFSSINSTSAVMKKFTTVVRNDANAALNVHATPSEMSPGPPVKISDSSGLMKFVVSAVTMPVNAPPMAPAMQE